MKYSSQQYATSVMEKIVLMINRPYLLHNSTTTLSCHKIQLRFLKKKKNEVGSLYRIRHVYAWIVEKALCIHYLGNFQETARGKKFEFSLIKIHSTRRTCLRRGTRNIVTNVPCENKENKRECKKIANEEEAEKGEREKEWEREKNKKGEQESLVIW